MNGIKYLFIVFLLKVKIIVIYGGGNVLWNFELDILCYMKF